MRALFTLLGASVAVGLPLIVVGLFPRAVPATPRVSRRPRTPLSPGRPAGTDRAALVAAVTTRRPAGTPSHHDTLEQLVAAGFQPHLLAGW